MIDFASIANNAISELKRVKGDNLRFSTPTYLAIREDDIIDNSNLWLILKDAKIAVVILPFSYVVITAEDSSAFILFIDDKGYCSDSININGWNLRFDAPKENLYRTYNRIATISRGGYEISLLTPSGTIYPNDFIRIWKYFKLISTINDDYSSLKLYAELYDNDIKIESLKKENIRYEYELFKTEVLLKAHKELLENINKIKYLSK